MREMMLVMRDALWVVMACSALGLAVNALRPNGIALVQKQPYQILVPCPVTDGQADAIHPGDAELRGRGALFVDARPLEHYQAWHAEGAIHLPYDYLEATSSEKLNRIAASGAQRVIVYGDGGDPDSGEQLAREIAGKGIRNVGFLVGGSGALKGTTAEARPP